MASSSGQGTRVFSATGSMHHRQPRNKNTVAARDMTSLQLLGGGGWPARLAEVRVWKIRWDKIFRKKSSSSRTSGIYIL